MNLSVRLQKIADFIPEGGTVADVGTDHGHLPVYLVALHKKEHAIAMDVRPGPLSRAAESVRAHGLEQQIETRLSDGLDALSAGEADTVVIAGMGGPLICDILSRGSHMWDSVQHWIVSPQSEWGKTRRWLQEHGFCIEREDFVFDAGKYYLILDVVRGKMPSQQDYEYAYGRYLITRKNPVLGDYLREEREKTAKLYSRLKEMNLEEQRLEEVRLRCRLLEEAWNAWNRSI